MSQVAKIFTNGRSQAVRLPAAFRFDAAAVDAIMVPNDRAFVPAAAHLKMSGAFSGFELESWVIA